LLLRPLSHAMRPRTIAVVMQAMVKECVTGTRTAVQGFEASAQSWLWLVCGSAFGLAGAQGRLQLPLRGWTLLLVSKEPE